MTVIELPDDLAAALQAEAKASQIKLEDWLRLAMARTSKPIVHNHDSVLVASGNSADDVNPTRQRPLKTGRGLLAPYGPAPSAEEIEENRQDMFSCFAQDF